MVSSGKFIGGVLLAALVWTAVWVPGFGHATSHVSTVVDTGPGAWTEVSPPLSPPAMAGAMMAYSSKSDRFVLFGGWDGVTSLNATWQYDPENRSWMDLHPP
ncbi:MAG TPA: kelch repeat-containing protein, partial [Thermoplasmata archaeon]|nr:kelch repeat-containing protein [Thermoplasmata archaeon]